MLPSKAETNIVEMQGPVNKGCMNQLVTTALGNFTQEQVEELVFSMDDDIYADLEKRYCHYGDDEFMDEPIEAEPRQKKPGKLFGFFTSVEAHLSGKHIVSKIESC